jgi:hypothetical protein
MTYRTTRPTAKTKALIRNSAIWGTALSLALLNCWFDPGNVLSIVIAVVSAIMLAALLMLYQNTRTPLEINGDQVIIRSLITATLPLSKVVGIGEHPVRKEPTLTYNDPQKGQSGELRLPWSYIAESREDVVTAIHAAIEGCHVKVTP